MKILITGTHLTPALAVIEELKKNYHSEIVYVGRNTTLEGDETPSVESQILPKLGVKFVSIIAGRLQRTLTIYTIPSLLKIPIGFLQALFIILAEKPDVILSFGGYVAVPSVFVGWLFSIPIIIHDQTLVSGLANKISSFFADKIAISFNQTKNYLKSNHKIVFTGNPIRQELRVVKDRQEALSFFGFDDNKFTILVMGGSQGSHRINTCFLKAVSMITDKSRFQIIHLAGPKDLGLLDSGYRDLQAAFKLFSFLKEMQYAYSIADFAITRAGATTIAELAFFGIPAIIIPYPFAYKHQFNNAQALSKHATAILIKDNELDPEKLREVLVDLMNNPNKIKLMRSHYNRISKTNANDLLIDEVLSLMTA